jgi:hypothetical protein
MTSSGSVIDLEIMLCILLFFFSTLFSFFGSISLLFMVLYNINEVLANHSGNKKDLCQIICQVICLNACFGKSFWH